MKHSPHESSPGKRQRVAETADALGLSGVLRPLHDRGRRRLVVLAYHRIVPLVQNGSEPLDLDLISATPSQFDWQMAYIRRRMQPVSLQQIVQYMDGKCDLPARAVAVTFDDGFEDTYQYAFPVLRRYEIPASVFITTGYVDSGEPFWFELVAQLMLRLPPHSLELEDTPQRFPSGPSREARRQSLRVLHQALKSLRNDRRNAVLSEWRAAFAQHIDRSSTDTSRPISWSQVLEMAACDIGFGSHTVSHPNLTQVPERELAWELAESKRVMETRLDRDVDMVAYPIGTRAAYDERVIRESCRAGYRLGVTYVTGANWMPDLLRFELRRHGIGLRTSQSYFRTMMNLPDWVE